MYRPLTQSQKQKPIFIDNIVAIQENITANTLNTFISISLFSIAEFTWLLMAALGTFSVISDLQNFVSDIIRNTYFVFTVNLY